MILAMVVDALGLDRRELQIIPPVPSLTRVVVDDGSVHAVRASKSARSTKGKSVHRRRRLSWSEAVPRWSERPNLEAPVVWRLALTLALTHESRSLDENAREFRM